MTKIINIHTGEERTHESPKPPECNICSFEVDKKNGGVTGKMGMLTVSFCHVCITGIIGMLMENNDKRT